MTTSVYLSGPNIDFVDPTSQISADWKAFAATTFFKSGITVANPIDLDFSGIATKIVDPTVSIKHSLNLIDRADSLLANLVQITEPATMEVFYANRQGKQVVVIGNEPFNPWVLKHSEIQFSNLTDAVEYLVNQPSVLDAVTWSTQFEGEIKKKSEQYPPPGENDFEYYGGDMPILVIAPHATHYFHDGNLHESESYTGTLAALLHKLTGCHAIISKHCIVADPVYYLSSPFAHFLSSLISKSRFKLVIALHGIEEWNSANDLIITSWNKSSLIDKAEYLNLLINLLKIKEFKDIGFDTIDLMQSEAKTINHLLFEDLNVPMIRLEIHRRYRLPQLQPSLYKSLYTSLGQFLMIIGSGK